MSKNHLAIWIHENLDAPLLTEIKIVDDIEKHSKHANEKSGGNVEFKYIPIHAAYNAPELVTRLHNLVNAETPEEIAFRKAEALETLKKVI